MEALDRRDRFVAYVVHELRTPITLQLALAEATLADPEADERAWRAMGEDVVAGCERQQGLIDALLDLTLSRGGLRRRQPVDVAAIAARALQAHELRHLDSRVALEPAVAIGHPTLLARLADNLVANAVRHNVPGGRIEVATRTEGGRAVLSVANTGPRIPSGEVARLFEPFERFGGGSEPGDGGVGLGLAIVQSIADAHDAALVAHAPTEGGLAIEVVFRAADASEILRADAVARVSHLRARAAGADQAPSAPGSPRRAHRAGAGLSRSR